MDPKICPGSSQKVISSVFLFLCLLDRLTACDPHFRAVFPNPALIDLI